MKTPPRPVFRLLPAFAALAVPPAACRAQPPAPPPQDPAPGAQRPTPSPADQAEMPAPPGQPALTFKIGSGEIDPDGEVRAAGGVSITFPGGSITAERVEGNLNRELVFRGGTPRLTYRGLTSDADTIHFFPATQSFRLENPRATLPPRFAEGRLDDDAYLRGGTLGGTRFGSGFALGCDTSTCDNPDHPHYKLRFASADYLPGERITLRRVGVYLFGQKLVTLPTVTIPLNRRAPQNRFRRQSYLPEVGQNAFEGYFARFPYEIAVGALAAAFLRLDLTQKQGPGYRVEQSYLAGKQGSDFETGGVGSGFGGYGGGGYGGGGFSGGLGGGSGAFGAGGGTFLPATYRTANARLPRLGTGLGPQSGGLFSAQGYLGEGTGRNFNASLRHQQGVGSNNRVAFLSELQNNSFYGFQEQKTQNSRFNFAHNDPGHGVNADLALGLNTQGSPFASTSQVTGSYRHAWEIASRGTNRNSLSVNFDASRFLTQSFSQDGTLASLNRTARLNSELQFQKSASDYTLAVQANKVTPVGFQSNANAFGTLERLPDVLFRTDTLNYKGGWLKRIPASFEAGLGRFFEPGTDTNTERGLFGLTVRDFTVARGRTEISTGGAFSQWMYGDGAAQYLVRNTSRLRQRLGRRSGFDINYQYQEPAGGTSFLFDQLARSHFLSAEGGYLDDSRFQLTARVGYDLTGTNGDRPWQTVSTRLMWRPVPSARFDASFSYDPNESRFIAVSSILRLRGRNDFALDIATRYDPRTGKFAQVNSQFDIPFGRAWRFGGLVRYDGLSGQFVSTSVQLSHRWDCLEAILSYVDTPLGFRSQKQFQFAFRITAFPFLRPNTRGPAGEALGIGLGDLY